MRRNSFISIPQVPPTGTDAPPPTEGCERIDTDQNNVPWGDMPQPFDETSWVRGETSLAIGKFESYLYFENTGGLDQFLVLSQTTGAFQDAENLQIAISQGGPWTDSGIDADTPVDQVAVDCDVACVASECDAGGFISVGPIGEPDDDDVLPGAFTPGAEPFGEWVGRYSYDTTLPGGSTPPFLSGSVIGAVTQAVAQVAQWNDPFPSPGNLVLVVDGSTLGRQATRFIHGETLDHGRTTAQVTLSNPMLEKGPLPLP